MTSLRTFSIVALFSLTLAATTGCHKDEAKAEPGAPADTTVTTTGGAQPQVQVQTAGTSVKINPGSAPAAPAAQAPAGAPKPATAATPAANVGATKVVLRADDGRTVRVGDQGTELKAADGRAVHITNGEIVAEDPNRPGAKIRIPTNGKGDLGN
jgi:hypothetical protein